jgi:hypothetical protein
VYFVAILGAQSLRNSRHLAPAIFKTGADHLMLFKCAQVAFQRCELLLELLFSLSAFSDFYKVLLHELLDFGLHGGALQEVLLGTNFKLFVLFLQIVGLLLHLFYMQFQLLFDSDVLPNISFEFDQKLFIALGLLIELGRGCDG